MYSNGNTTAHQLAPTPRLRSPRQPPFQAQSPDSRPGRRHSHVDDFLPQFRVASGQGVQFGDTWFAARRVIGRARRDVHVQGGGIFTHFDYNQKTEFAVTTT